MRLVLGGGLQPESLRKQAAERLTLPRSFVISAAHKPMLMTTSAVVVVRRCASEVKGLSWIYHGDVFKLKGLHGDPLKHVTMMKGFEPQPDR